MVIIGNDICNNDVITKEINMILDLKNLIMQPLYCSNEEIMR
jgi:hypothetical protein